MHPLRVLQVINSLDVAGAEVLVTQLAKGLRKKGMTADVAVLRLFQIENRGRSSGKRVPGAGDRAVEIAVALLIHFGMPDMEIGTTLA